MQTQPERHIGTPVNVHALSAATRAAAAIVAGAGTRPWAIFRQGASFVRPALVPFRKLALDSRSRIQGAARPARPSDARPVLGTPMAVNALAGPGEQATNQLHGTGLRHPHLRRRVSSRPATDASTRAHRPGSRAAADQVSAPRRSDPSTIRVVTVAYQGGTSGEAVGRAVAEQLGFRYVDGEVLQVAAEAAGLSLENLVAATQHHGILQRFVESFAYSTADPIEMWVGPTTLRALPLATAVTYRSLVETAIRDLVAPGAVVVAGHGAEFVLANRADVLRVLVTGGLVVRATRACTAGATQAQAIQALRKADRERLAYFRRFYKAGWLDPATYDLTVNTDRLAIDDAARAIVTAIAGRTTFRGDLSR